MSKFSILVLILVTSFLVGIQTYTTANSFINWDLNDTSNSNIPDNNITDITRDKDGAIWVCTDNGFAKYLGQHVWQVYHTPNVTFNDVCLSIVSQDSIIWVATVNGLVRYCNSQITLYDDNNSALGTSYILSLAVESDILWVGTLEYGLYKFNGTSFQNYTYTNTGNMPLGNIWSIAVDEGGKKWMSCADARIGAPNFGNVVSYDNTTWTSFDTSNSDLERFPRGVSIDNNSNIWITDLQGHLKKYDVVSWVNFDSSNVSPQAVFGTGEVAFDSAQSKWICTSTGIASFDDTNWMFYDSSNVPFTDAIKFTRCIFVDSTNNKYIGTNGDGLLIFNENGIVDDINFIQNENDFTFSGTWINNELLIRLTSSRKGNYKLSVFNTSGNSILGSKYITNADTEIETTLDFTGKSSGIYFLQFEKSGIKKSYKVIYLN